MFERKMVCKRGHVRGVDTCYAGGHCKACKKAQSRAAVARDPEKYRRKSRAHHLKRSYGLTLADYEKMCAAQDAKCYVCMRTARLIVDHDHSTGEVRHLLCYTCNSMIGLAQESEEILRRAIDYVRS